MAAKTKGAAGSKSLTEIESMLAKMKLDNDWSMNQLKDEIHDRGICLKNGKEYGPGLPFVLKKHPALVVSKSAVREYPLARKCRVKVPCA